MPAFRLVASGLSLLVTIVFIYVSVGRAMEANAQEFPTAVATLTNNTGQIAGGIHLNLATFAGSLQPLTGNAPGCGAPAYSTPGWPYTTLDVTWPAPCVDPGESVTFTFVKDCTASTCGPQPPTVSSFNWTNLQPTPEPTPAPASTPLAPAVGGIVGLVDVPADHESRADAGRINHYLAELVLMAALIAVPLSAVMIAARRR